MRQYARSIGVLSCAISLLCLRCGGTTETADNGHHVTVADSGTSDGATGDGRHPGVCTGQAPQAQTCPSTTTCVDAGPLCFPDQCHANSDCGGMKACICGSPPSGVGQRAGLNQPNVCAEGNCMTDADCPGTCCRLSVPTSCGTVQTGIAGYFCRTVGDECETDSDCGNVIAKCGYAPEVGHWKCVAAQACG